MELITLSNQHIALNIVHFRINILHTTHMQLHTHTHTGVRDDPGAHTRPVGDRAASKPVKRATVATDSLRWQRQQCKPLQETPVKLPNKTSA